MINDYNIIIINNCNRYYKRLSNYKFRPFTEPTIGDETNTVAPLELKIIRVLLNHRYNIQYTNFSIYLCAKLNSENYLKRSADEVVTTISYNINYVHKNYCTVTRIY